MVRRHHGDEVAVDVAGRLGLHGVHHLGHRGFVFGEESAFIRCRSLLRRRMSFMREHREHQRRSGESDEEAHAEDRRAQAGFEKSQHRRSTFSGSSSNALQTACMGGDAWRRILFRRQATIFARDSIHVIVSPWPMSFPRCRSGSRDKASVCGQKSSGYKGLPHHARKPHVPGSKFFFAENVRPRAGEPARRQHPHHRVHEALSDLRRARRGLPGLGSRRQRLSSTASTISPRRFTATPIPR